MFSRARVSMLSMMLFAIVSTATARDVPENTLPTAKARAVDQAVHAAMIEQKLVGLAIGIFHQGRVVYLKGYGDANREQSVPVTADTKFNWASNSKPVAAVLAMQLIEKKKLNLDTDVRKYVPEFPEKGHVITTRHLLCHQSGIPHYANGKIVPTVRKYDEADPFSQPVLALDKFNQSPLIFSPGEKVDYSSYAYILLSAVIERAGEQPFYEQLQSRIAQPLKLTSFDSDTNHDDPELAVGYAKQGESIVKSLDEAQSWKHGAGAYRSNVRDFARWAEALLNRRLVTEQAQTAMWTIQPTKDGKPTTWGLGFTVENGSQGFKVSHNGSQPEVATRMVLYPKAKHGVVVMTNSGYADVGKISTTVYSALNAK